jgi:putative Holliday junction resolvase
MASALPSSPDDSVLQPAGTRRGPVLAIDYGTQRLGLAISDELGFTARPLDTWTRTNRRNDLSRLRELCRLHAVRLIVVGWPIRLDGTPGEMADEARRFAERVHKSLGMAVELVDERLSSWEARQTAHASASRKPVPAARGNKVTPVDDIAAAVILRDYLSRNQNAQPDALQE